MRRPQNPDRVQPTVSAATPSCAVEAQPTTTRSDLGRHQLRFLRTPPGGLGRPPRRWVAGGSKNMPPGPRETEASACLEDISSTFLLAPGCAPSPGSAEALGGVGGTGDWAEDPGGAR